MITPSSSRREAELLKRVIRLFSLLLLMSVAETPPSDKTVEEEKLDQLKFQELKEIIKQDKLAGEAKKKLQQQQRLRKLRQKAESERYYYPSQTDFWEIISELWLTKNAVPLKWEFEKSDLGIGMATKKIFEDLGIRDLSVRLLMLNSYEVPHMALPSKPQEVIFLLSLPFIREMDLSKVEIALLLVEDYWRWKNGFFLQQLSERGYEKKWGKRMIFPKGRPKKPDMEFVSKLLDDITKFVFKVGYTFDQQFQVTKQMRELVNTNKSYTKAYESLLKKRQDLVIKQPKFGDYSKRYPSPEMQLQWFSK